MSNKVKFIKKTEIKKEKTILEIADDLKVKIKEPCNGKGKCGKCLVKVLDGKVSEITKAESKLISEKKLEKGYRLACQAIVEGDVTIELVDKSD